MSTATATANELMLVGDQSLSITGTRGLVPSPLTFEQKIEMAKYVAESGFWKSVNTPAKVMALMQLCESEGLNPMQAMTRYHLIEGRPPSMKSETMQAEFQARGGIIRFLQWDDKCCRALFSHPSSPEPVEVEWTIERAQQAGIYGRNATWKSYPRNMLKARVISDGVRLVLPGATLGMYTPEEESDIAAEEREKAMRGPQGAPPVRSSAPPPSMAQSQPQRQQTQPVNTAEKVTPKAAFARAADFLGQDVKTEKGTWSNPKLFALANNVALFLGETAFATVNDITDTNWRTLTSHLEAYTERVKADAEAEKTMDATEAGTDELEDPFTDDDSDTPGDALFAAPTATTADEPKPKSAMEGGL